jgi:hypothetical protein
MLGMLRCSRPNEGDVRMSGLVPDWRCGDDGRGNPGLGNAGYETGSPFIGAHVIHLWDRRARFFYGYRIGIGQAPHFDYDRNEYQTLGAALLAAERRMKYYGPLIWCRVALRVKFGRLCRGWVMHRSPHCEVNAMNSKPRAQAAMWRVIANRGDRSGTRF